MIAMIIGIVNLFNSFLLIYFWIKLGRERKTLYEQLVNERNITKKYVVETLDQERDTIADRFSIMYKHINAYDKLIVEQRDLLNKIAKKGKVTKHETDR